MKNERFYRTIEGIWFSDLSYFGEGETHFLKDVTHCLQTYGDFLDQIPLEDRSSIAYSLLRLVEDIYFNKYRKAITAQRNPVRPTEKRNSYLNTIRKMKDILDNEGFTGPIFSITPMEDILEKQKKVEEREPIYSFLCSLEKDLEEENYEYFEKESFKEVLTKKGDLESYLLGLVDKYDIKRAKRKAINLSSEIFQQ